MRQEIKPAQSSQEELKFPDSVVPLRKHVTYAVSHIMKVYGLAELSCNPSAIGAYTVFSPAYRTEDSLARIAPPKELSCTMQHTARLLADMLAMSGVSEIRLEYDDKDRTQVAALWSEMEAKK